MEKKKILKLTLIIILALLVVFLGLTFRKMIIIKDLNKKVSKYLNNDNYYEKIINNSDSTATVTEYYCKGDKAVIFLNTTIKSTGETRKLINHFKGEKTNTYIETSVNKIALLDSNGLPSKIRIVDLDYGDNWWHLFQIAATSSIKYGKHNDKECYILNFGNMEQTYFEKETGLLVKMNYGTETDENGKKSDIIVEYYYEFGNVNDDIFVEPDISQYTIQENS